MQTDNKIKAESLNRSGVYKITIGDHIYIGSTLKVLDRKHVHLWNLRLGKHKNKNMQNLFNQHGEQAFKYAVIEYCDAQNRIEREQFYVDIIRPDINIRKTVETNDGLKHSLETRKQMSLMQKGRVFSQKTRMKMSMAAKARTSNLTELQISEFKTRIGSNPNARANRVKAIKALKSKAISQHDLLGVFINSFESINEASRQTGIDCSYITKVLKGKRSHSCGFTWRYL